MLMVSKQKKLWLIILVIFVSLFGSLINPAPTNALISSEDYIECYDFAYHIGPNVESMIRADINDADCGAPPGTYFYTFSSSDGLVSQYFSAGQAIDVNNCDGSAGIVVGTEIIDITISGEPNHEICNETGGEGAVRIELTIDNLHQILENNEVGPFSCTVETEAGQLLHPRSHCRFRG